ncbi:protease complex subunit PrcB family protein [Poriferisphaera sp. WC338]|uniref:protease complex subunit PrcB family protein n=1 Tax=Poriferisphaera sp. WC338 TaxID=3425129 RepID=UPI003D8126DD
MLKKMASVLVVAVLAGGMLVGCQGEQKVEENNAQTSNHAAAEPVAIKSKTHGSDKAMNETGVTLVKSDEEWDALGMQGDKPNFNEESVVVLSLGEVPTGGYWARITGVQQVGDVLYVQGIVNQPGSEEVVTEAIEYPYCVAVIEKVDANDVQYDVQEVSGQQPAAE